MLPLNMLMKLGRSSQRPRARTNPAAGPGAPVSVIIDKGRGAPREIQSACESSVQVFGLCMGTSRLLRSFKVDA
jgi:hypothetical protein